MEKYQVIKKLGAGSFGNVEMAEDKQTKEIVAIKRLKKKYGTWEQCLQLAQVKALRKMNHPNVVRMKQVIRVLNEAYFIFQYIEQDLYKLTTERKERGQGLSEWEIRHIAKQLVEAVLYVHRQGFFHRDLKPQNLLVAPDLTVKLIDFGIAREIRSKPPFTEYVSTRWYRAPEMLFRFPSYSAPVDIWAVGCIVAEMYLGRPIFLGTSEMDQISKIVSVLGTPGSNWPEGVKQAAKKGIGIPEYPQIALSAVIPNCPSDALNFITECLRWDPTKRLTSAQIVAHPFFSKENIEMKPHHEMNMKKMNSMGQKNNFKIERKFNQKLPLRTNSLKPAFDKDEQFDELLKDFKNYQVGSSKKEGTQSAEDEDEWF